LEPVVKGTRLLEYEGERITKEEGDLRYEGRPFTYLFGIGKGDVVIDGHGMAMFVNHSCQPNCETDEIGGRVYIIAIRNIKAGEELTYDYWLYDGDDDAPCYCGSKKCRGSMYSPPELKKKKARAAQNQKQLQGQMRKAAKRSVTSKANGSGLAKR
jgi:SET domain-containing protein